MFEIGAYDSQCTAIGYFVPNRKKAIAKSTIAEMDALRWLHANHPKATFAELRNIMEPWICYSDTKAVLDAHIKAGFGSYVPDW